MNWTFKQRRHKGKKQRYFMVLQPKWILKKQRSFLKKLVRKNQKSLKKQALIGELTEKSRKSGYYYRNLKKTKEGTATVTKKNAVTIDSFLKGDVETKDQKENDEEGNSDDVELITDDEVTTSTKVFDQQDLACTGSMVVKRV